MISHYAGGPKYGMEFRSYYMAKEWVKQGHEVLIVGASFSHLRGKQPNVCNEIIDGIEYRWLKINKYKGNGIKRILSMFFFVFNVYYNKKKLIKFNPNVVIASSVYTFDIYPAKKIAKKCNAKLVYEVHDLWPLSPMIIGGYSKYNPFIFLLQKGENYAYKYCDKVISILDKAYPHMEGHGLKLNKFCCIPNGYKKEEWENIDTKFLPEEHEKRLKELKEKNKIIIGFAGGHTQSTAMNILIEAAKILQTNTKLIFVLVGEGQQKQQLIELANSYAINNIIFLPAIEKKYIPKLISYFDITYMGGVHSSLHKYGTSFNKMTDYMLSAKPIIFSVDEPNSLIEKVGCGIQVEAENPKLVVNAIIKLVSMTKEERQAMGEKGKKYAEENLEYSVLARKFIEYIN